MYIEWYKIIEKNIVNDADIDSDFKLFYKKFDIAKKIKKMNSKEYLLSNSFQVWPKIQEFIERIQPNLKEKYKKIAMTNNAMLLNISDQLKIIDKNIERLSDEMEGYLLIHTSLKMDILSEKYIYKIKVNEDSYKPIFSGKERSPSEVTYSQRNEVEIKSIISEKKIKDILKSITIPESHSQEGFWFIRSNFDNTNKKPFLQRKKNNFSPYSSRKSFRTSGSILKFSELEFFDKSCLNSESTSIEKFSSSNYTDLETIITNEGEVPWLANNRTIEIDTEIISIKGTYIGSCIIDDHYILFNSKPDKIINNEIMIVKEEKDDIIYTSALPETILKKEFTKYWSVNELKEIIPRRYIHTYSAIEIFFHNGKSKFFNFHTEKNCQLALSKLKSYEIYKIYILSRNDVSKYMKLWKSGKLSNFDYLMILNKYSGRSFNDLSQYPVFPWILADYSSPELNLASKETFRNLESPLCAQTKEGKKKAENTYKISKEDASPYNYGSHYSNGGFVLHYLMRLEPYATQSWYLQGGKFNIPDRLFVSVENSYKGSQTYLNDCKELIPEMFYLPELLININSYKLGRRQNGEEVQRVALPTWAANSEFNFIRLHRKALESPYVSQNIHLWIDLIFGYKQQNNKAKEFYNLYYPLTYEKNFLQIIKNAPKIDKLAIFHQVIHFGQTPIQIFAGPHPKKDDMSIKIQIFEKIIKNSDHFLHTICKSFKPIGVILNNSRYLMFIQFSRFIKLIKYKQRSENLNEYAFVDKNELKGIPFVIREYFLAVAYKEDYIVTGGYDNSYIYISDLEGNLIKAIKNHSEPISCLAGRSLIASGSRDSTIVVFNLEENLLLHGHINSITNISIVEDLCIIVSSSLKLILIHDYRTGEILNKFDIDCITLQANNSGIVAVETHDYYLIFYINGQLMNKISRIKPSAWSLISEIIMISQEEFLYCVDVYDNKSSNLSFNKELNIEKIVYSYRKDSVFLIDHDNKYVVSSLNFL